MDYKKSKAPTTTQTRNTHEFEQKAENIYEAVVVAGKRANQISAEIKEELNQKLEEFANYTDNLEEVFENREQIEISRFYERLPKPTLIALDELENGMIHVKNQD